MQVFLVTVSLFDFAVHIPHSVFIGIYGTHPLVKYQFTDYFLFTSESLLVCFGS